LRSKGKGLTFWLGRVFAGGSKRGWEFYF